MTVDQLRERTVVTVREAGAVMGYMSESACYRAVQNRRIPGLRKVGRKWLVSAPVLLDWLLNGDTEEANENVTPLRNVG